METLFHGDNTGLDVPLDDVWKQEMFELICEPTHNVSTQADVQTDWLIAPSMERSRCVAWSLAASSKHLRALTIGTDPHPTQGASPLFQRMAIPSRLLVDASNNVWHQPYRRVALDCIYVGLVGGRLPLVVHTAGRWGPSDEEVDT